MSDTTQPLPIYKPGQFPAFDPDGPKSPDEIRHNDLKAALDELGTMVLYGGQNLDETDAYKNLRALLNL